MYIDYLKKYHSYNNYKPLRILLNFDIRKVITDVVNKLIIKINTIKNGYK